MKKLSKVLIVATLIALVTAAVAFAAYVPTADNWGDSVGTTNNGTATTLKLFASNVSACGPTSTAYIKFDLSTVTSSIASATLTVTADVASFNQPITVSVFQAGPTAWSEAAAVSLTNPGVTGSALTTLTINTQPAAGTALVFPTSTAFASYLDTARTSGGVANLALQITGCGTGAPRLDIRSRESANPPSLAPANANAVTVVESQAQTSSWPLYAGLAAVALVVVAGVLISRRRTA